MDEAMEEWPTKSLAPLIPFKEVEQILRMAAKYKPRMDYTAAYRQESSLNIS
jgi:hypothetical protein